LPPHRFRDKRIFHAFRQARLSHYVGFFLLRSPALLTAVGVYTHSTQIPPCDNSEAKRVLTVDMGIHRHAIFKVAGKVVGEVSVASLAKISPALV